MATMTNAPTVAGGARPPQSSGAQVVGRRTRLRMTAACYAGIVGLVVIAFLLADLVPAAVGIPLFVALTLGVVLIAHPTVRITQSN